MHVYGSMEVCKYASMHICKYASMQVCKYAHTCKYESRQVNTCLMNKETDVTYLRFAGFFQHKLTAHWRKKESPS